MSYAALDLCAGGAGGWSLGLHRAGFNTVAACEAVGWRRQMLAHNFPGAKLYDDLRTLTGARIEDDLGYLPDFVAGSPPCKEYSEVNTRGRGLDGDDLFMHAVRLVAECRPRWCAFENSARIRDRGYDRIAGELENLGYTCWPFVLSRFGARHGRPRAVIIAADLSRPQGRASGLARQHGDVGPGADRSGRCWPGLHCGSLGPSGTQPLGWHLREYDGLPTGLADRCREAYGDAVFPQLTEAVGRAILRTDAAIGLAA